MGIIMKLNEIISNNNKIFLNDREMTKNAKVTHYEHDCISGPKNEGSTLEIWVFTLLYSYAKEKILIFVSEGKKCNFYARSIVNVTVASKI